MRTPLASLINERVGPRFSYSGYSISRAQSPREAAEAFRFRHRIFSEEGLIESDDFPDGLFCDRFDEVSTHILVRDSGGELVGTTRFIHPSEIGYLTEELFDFDSPEVERSQLGEFGRLAIAPEHRGGMRGPMLAMLKAVFECMVESRVTYVYAFLPPQLAESYAALGCVFLSLTTTPPSESTVQKRSQMQAYFQAQEVAPVLFDLREMMAEVGVDLTRRELGFAQPRSSSGVKTRRLPKASQDYSTAP